MFTMVMVMARGVISFIGVEISKLSHERDL